MSNNDLVFSKNNKNTATVSISSLLRSEDYESIWIDNGQSGFESENVLAIRELFEPFIKPGEWCDLQVWEEGNAFVNNIDVDKLEDLRIAIEKFSNDTYDLAERM